MNATLKKTCCSIKEWMVPPVLIPLAIIIMIVLWSVLRPHMG